MNDYALATVKAVATEEGPGQFEAILSTSALDRDGEMIEPGAFEPLPASIPIYFEHDWKSGAAPVGRGTPFYDDGVLRLSGTFASTAKAQEVRSLVVEGVVDAMSVGFLNAQREQKSGVKTVVGGTVFEGSLTAIPVNTGAKMLAAKALGMKAGARNNGTDAGRLQQIHDLAAENGASSAGAKHVSPTTKAIEGSVEALQERVTDALEDTYGPGVTELRGVLPDVVVFDLAPDTSDDDESEAAETTFKQVYTDDGAVVTLEGEPTEVDVHEVIAPDADADREAGEPGPTVLSLTAKSPAASTAASAPVDPAADEAAQAKARIRLITATAI